MTPTAVLAFERHWWLQAGNKEQAIRDTFNVSPTSYYQHLREVVGDPESLRIDPTTVRRLQRIMRLARRRWAVEGARFSHGGASDHRIEWLPKWLPTHPGKPKRPAFPLVNRWS